MRGHYVRTGRQVRRQPKQRWDMEKIAMLLPNASPQCEISLGRTSAAFERNRAKVRRQLRHIEATFRIADQQEFVLVINRTQRPNNVPDVSPNSEITDGADVDADSHRGSISRQKSRDRCGCPIQASFARVG